MIPTFMFEDMNEAAVLWYYGIRHQFLSAEGNSILYVNQYASDRPQLSHLYGFHPNEISLANFIIPPIHRGIFKQVYWLHPNNHSENQMQWICTYELAEDEDDSDNTSTVLSYKILDKKEVSTKQLLRWKLKPKYKLAELQHLTVDEDLPVNPVALDIVALDIVLDYFISPSKVAEKEDYTEKVDRFVSFCRDRIQPKLICIRRSRLSGLIGDRPWQSIEEYLFNKLDQLYGLEVIQLDTLWEDKQLTRQFEEEEVEVRKFVRFQETQDPVSLSLDQLSDRQPNQMTELSFPYGKINVYDNLIPSDLLVQIYDHYKNNLCWEFQNIGDGDDVLPSFSANGNFPDIIYQLQSIVREKLSPETADPRIYINGHVFGLGDGIHRDSYQIHSPGKTAVCYINPMWRADWDGETKFYDRRDPGQADLIYSCLPKPGRVIIFDNTIPHRGCPPNRLCNKLRITVAYQFPAISNN